MPRCCSVNKSHSKPVYNFEPDSKRLDRYCLQSSPMFVLWASSFSPMVHPVETPSLVWKQISNLSTSQISNFISKNLSPKKLKWKKRDETKKTTSENLENWILLRTNIWRDRIMGTIKSFIFFGRPLLFSQTNTLHKFLISENIIQTKVDTPDTINRWIMIKNRIKKTYQHN